MHGLAIALYRSLVKSVQRTQRLFPEVSEVQLRPPISGGLGTYQHIDLGPENPARAAEQVVPDLEVPPGLAVLTWKDIRKLIRANFEANKGVQSQEALQSLTNQAFTSLRAVPEQAYLQACSCTTGTDGVVVEATSCHSDNDPASGAASQAEKSFFPYRIRIINNRQCRIRVLGRQWVIQHANGHLEAMVQLSPDNGIVGQQPVIHPQYCFEYYSGAYLTKRPGGEETPSGLMTGVLLVDLYGEDDAAPPERVQVPVGPFKLMPAAREAA